jgi:hypothetical protein
LFSSKKYYTLVFFRVIFGILTLFSSIRFLSKGWINELYLEPTFHFKYYGFEWVQVATDTEIYILFGLMIASSLLIVFGFLYRFATVLFFLLFTYFELIDLTNYLNHYYFVSLMAFILIFLPANCNYSLDAKFGFTKRRQLVPAWTIGIVFFQLLIVYFYAGLAKLNYEWLIEANPLKIWLAPHTNLPIIGSFMDEPITAYLFSWGGAIFDLCVPFLLLNKKTRLFGYGLVIIFHSVTSLLFPIGMFPFVMMMSTLVFFSQDFHKKILNYFYDTSKIVGEQNTIKSVKYKWVIFVFVGFQIVFPFRYLMYNNDLFYTEQGYRFSWRVMLMEKAGYASFKIHPFRDARSIEIDNSKYLTPQQEKMMSTQPDFILQYAHYLGHIYKEKYGEEVEVKADIFISVNGRPSQKFVKKDLDLLKIKNDLKPITWLEEYK